MPPDSTNPTPPARACPICGKPAVPQHRPFCSVRCAHIDLGRWLNDSYRIPAEDDPEDETGDDRNRD